VAYTGYLVDPDTASADDPGGVFARVEVSPTHITFRNCISRAEVAYLSRTLDGSVLLGNRARVLAQIASGCQPRLNVPALLGLVTGGFIVGEGTPYQGVTALPPGARAIISPQGLAVECEEVRDIPRGRDLKSLARDCLDVLCDHLRVIRGLEGCVSLGLTGGKDSRLIAACAAAAGLRLATHTNGQTDDPECVIARRVARHLGLPHEVRPPSGASRGVVPQLDLLERLEWGVRLAEGMLNIYETFAPPKPALSYTLGGQSGEMIRGGFARKGQVDADAAQMASRLKAFAPLRNRALLAQQGCEVLECEFGTWWQTNVGSFVDPASLYDKYYLDYRVGRWLAHARHANQGVTVSIVPFLDDRLLRLAFGIPRDLRASDRLICEVLRQVAPKLVHIPLLNDRWNFDRKPPKWVTPWRRLAWQRRTPLKALAQRPISITWRTGYAGYLRLPISEVILDEKAAPLYEFIRRDVVEQWLGQEGPSPPHRVNSMMGPATAAYLLAK